MKILEKNKAIELRMQGKTFGEIIKQISVSKGSLSYWLRNIQLTPEQLLRINYKNDKIKKSFIEFNVPTQFSGRKAVRCMCFRRLL